MTDALHELPKAGLEGKNGRMMKVLEDAREGVRSFGYKRKGVNNYFAERGAGRGVIKALTTVFTLFHLDTED